MNSAVTSLMKKNAIIAATTFAITIGLYFPLKGSINASQYASPLKWLCFLGPISLIVAGIQCAKSEVLARKFLVPFVLGFALFISILAPANGESISEAKVLWALVFSVGYMSLSAVIEWARFKRVGIHTAKDQLTTALGFVPAAVAVGCAYLYDSEFFTKSRFDTHWFAYLSLVVPVFFTEAVFTSIRETLGELKKSEGMVIFSLLNAFLWIFFGTLFSIV